MNPVASRIATLIALVALVAGGLGVFLHQNARGVASGDAKSLCTNLAILEHDQRHGASYASDTLIAGYKADLLNLGFVCESGKLKEAEKIEVTNEMVPTTTPATCEADGKLVLPNVEHAAWEKKVNDTWEPASGDEGAGAYQLRLKADDGYALSAAPFEYAITVKARLTGDTCVVPEPEPDPIYACRTDGPNGGPSFLALDPGKFGEYNYGPPFLETTIEGARQSIHDQAWCDPVWMLQKYREYVDPAVSFEAAHVKALELIAQAKAGDNAQWDGMVHEIMSQFDSSRHEFTTIPAGEYHSLGVISNSSGGVPRVVDFVFYDLSPSRVLRSHVTYSDGTSVVLDLRTECNLQLRTPTTQSVPAAGVAPEMAQIPRDSEGTPLLDTPSTTTPPPTTVTTSPPGTSEPPSTTSPPSEDLPSKIPSVIPTHESHDPVGDPPGTVETEAATPEQPADPAVEPGSGSTQQAPGATQAPQPTAAVPTQEVSNDNSAPAEGGTACVDPDTGEPC